MNPNRAHESQTQNIKDAIFAETLENGLYFLIWNTYQLETQEKQLFFTVF